jgi:cell pole-organizing protein PopZ
MSASQPPETTGPPPGNDPSMEDILASIRRILSEEEPAPPPAPVAAAIAAVEPPVEPPASDEKPDDVLLLDPSMLVEEEAQAAEPEPPAPEPAPRLPLPPMDIMSPSALLAPEVEAAATISVGNLMRTLATERTMQVHRDGPTIEDIVREEVRPLLKQWLDAHLPDLVERLVRAEIERVVGRAVP